MSIARTRKPKLGKPQGVRTLAKYRGVAGGGGLLAVFALLILGCDSADPFPLATVQGTVAYRGKPLERGRVVFFPIDGTPGPTAVGTIEPDGTFRMRVLGHNGAAVGRHRITVHLCEQFTDEQLRQVDAIAPRSLIPRKYANPNTSGLLIHVRAGDENVCLLELTGRQGRQPNGATVPRQETAPVGR